MSADEIRYEKTDADAKPIVRYAVYLLIFTAVSAAISFAALHLFREREIRSDPPAGAMAVRDPDRLPPAPRLQVHPTMDASELRRQQETELTSYGWIDESQGRVRIPVERAMDLLVQRGLPTRPAPPAAGGPAPEPEPATGLPGPAAQPGPAEPPPSPAPPRMLQEPDRPVVVGGPDEEKQ